MSKPGARTTVSLPVSLLAAGEGGLTADSVALGEQVRAIATHCLATRRGPLPRTTMVRLDHALRITLDLE